METPACSKAQPALNSLRWIHYRGVIREGTQWFPQSLLQYTGELLNTKLTDLKSGLLFLKPISSLCLLSVRRLSRYWDVKCHQTNDSHQSKAWSAFKTSEFLPKINSCHWNCFNQPIPSKEQIHSNKQALPCWPYERRAKNTRTRKAIIVSYYAAPSTLI